MAFNLAQVTAQAKTRNPFYAKPSGGKFAQQSDLTHTCTTAMERNKNTTDDYLTIQAGSNKYTDINFPTNDALYWKDAGEDDRSMSEIAD